MSVLQVKIVKMRWRVGATPPDPRILRRLGEITPRPPDCAPTPLSNPGCATEQKEWTQTMTGLLNCQFTSPQISKNDHFC